MDNFWFGFGVGALVALAGLVFVADLAIEHSDKMCKRQGWKGEACQCRLLEKGEAAHD